MPLLPSTLRFAASVPRSLASSSSSGLTPPHRYAQLTTRSPSTRLRSRPPCLPAPSSRASPPPLSCPGRRRSSAVPSPPLCPSPWSPRTPSPGPPSGPGSKGGGRAGRFTPTTAAFSQDHGLAAGPAAPLVPATSGGALSVQPAGQGRGLVGFRPEAVPPSLRVTAVGRGGGREVPGTLYARAFSCCIREPRPTPDTTRGSGCAANPLCGASPPPVRSTPARGSAGRPLLRAASGRLFRHFAKAGKRRTETGDAHNRQESVPFNPLAGGSALYTPVSRAASGCCFRWRAIPGPPNARKANP